MVLVFSSFPNHQKKKEKKKKLKQHTTNVKKKMPKTKRKLKKKEPERSQKRDLSVLFFLLMRQLTTCDWFTGPLLFFNKTIY